MSNAISNPNKSKRLIGTATVPGDKSISHRAVLFNSLACGTSKLKALLMGEDVQATINAMTKLGVSISQQDEIIVVKGAGLHGLIPPKKVLDMGNSGTTNTFVDGRAGRL